MSVLGRRKSKLTLVLILSFLFCLAAIIFLINELIQNQAYFTRSFGNEQELLVQQIADRSKEALIGNTENVYAVIANIIKTTETSGSRYWFATKDNELFFLKDSFEMEQLKIKNVYKLLYSFKAANGYNIDALRSLADSRTNGTVLFSPSKAEKKILVSVFFFKINDINYSIGMCTTETYIVSAGKIIKHDTYSIMALVIVCLILFSAIIAGSIIINRKEDEVLINESTIRAKNTKIEELAEANLKVEMMYDEKTKLYGKDVLYALLEKANRPELFPFSMLVINIAPSENITFDDMVLELAFEIQKTLPKNSVATRVNENQLAILFFKTEYGKIKNYQERLLKAWSGTLNKLKTSVKTDVITQFIGQDAPIAVFELWNKMNSD